MSETSRDAPPSAVSPAAAVEALRRRLDEIDRAGDPIRWATTAYRLGMATAEQPAASPVANLQAALGLYQQAAEVLTAKRAPVEHARILNAAGSAHRLLGDRATAVRLFRSAGDLMADRGVPAEESSVLNNLGLVLAETGRVPDAIEVFNRSLALGPRGSEQERRTVLATKHNLAQAHLGAGTAEGCAAAIGVLDEALTDAATIEASLHTAMIHHSLGVAWKAQAGHEPDRAAEHLDRAVAAFEHSLGIFTSVGFPLQHAIAKHNLGHALAAGDELVDLRRALACYEDSLNIFDPRLHEALWREAMGNIEALEARLEGLAPGMSRADHVASYVGSMPEEQRRVFLRQRLAQMERLPAANQVERLAEFAYAVVRQPAASFVGTLRTTIEVLMELPETLLESALRAQLNAHGRLDPHDQRAADFILDEAIQALLFGPQRIRVRDMLEDIGWERP